MAYGRILFCARARRLSIAAFLALCAGVLPAAADDTVPPNSSIAAPLDGSFSNAASVVTVQGVSWDDVGVSSIAVNVQDVSMGGGSSCYIPGFGFNNDCATSWFKVYPINAWSFSLPVGRLTQAHQYVVLSSATDLAGNAQVAVSSAGFTYDIVEPTSGITSPPSPDDQFFSSMTVLWGTSRDDVSGVAQVKVKMWYLSGGVTYYWNPVLQGGKHWTTTDNGFYSIDGSAGGPGTGGVFNTWSYDTPDSHDPTSDSYVWKQATHDGLTGKTFYMMTQAWDYAGNAETHVSTRSFVFNDVPPTSGPSLPAPSQAYTNGQLATLTGAVSPATGTISGVAISLLSLDEPGGAAWLDFGSGLFSKPFQSDSWQSLLPSEVFVSSWAFDLSASPFVDGRHYVLYSTATDNIGNVQSAVGSAEVLFDSTPATSRVTWPPTAVTMDNSLVPMGLSYDSGFSGSIDCNGNDQISGTGSGVYPSCAWQHGKVEVAIYRDTQPVTSPELGFPGPLAYSGWGNKGYWWDAQASTWVPASSVASPPLWSTAAFSSAAGGWKLASLACPSSNPSNQPCWHNGDRYAVWSRVTDNAGNVQAIIQPAPVFFIAPPAQSFALSIDSNPSTAGAVNAVNLTVTAVDGSGGTGGQVAGYAQTVNFFVDGGAGPESMGDGLPAQYTFTVGPGGDNGSHTFPITLRKAGDNRQIGVYDASIHGILNSVQVQPGAASQVQIIADYDPSGQQPGPGVTTTGSEGRVGTPRSFLDDTQVKFLAQVVDQSWNLVVSSAVSVTINTSDTSSSCIAGNNSSLSFTGSATFNWTFAGAGLQYLWATGAGLYPNASNPSSAVGIVARSATRLVTMLPGETQAPGKFCGPGALGKTGSPADLLAGQVYTATVAAVDDYYNTDASVGYSVQSTVYTDPYAQPAVQSQNFVQGVTQFQFMPVTAGALALEAKSGSLSGATSSYDTAKYAPLSPVWWDAPRGLQLIVAGQPAAPGLPGGDGSYGFNPTTGGRSPTAPATLTAGVTTTITVNLVDAFYNVVAGPTPFMTAAQLFSSNTLTAQLDFPDDPNVKAWFPETVRYRAPLTAGTVTFDQVIPVTSTSSLRIQASDFSLGQFDTDTVTGVQVYSTAAASLEVLVPQDPQFGGNGEFANEGSTQPKLGQAGPLLAGVSYDVTVRAVDRFGNLIGPPSADTRSVGLNNNDPYATMSDPPTQSLSNGKVTFHNFIPSIATGALTVTAYDNSGANLPSQSDTNVQVVPGPPTQFMVVLPGQSLSGGKTTPPAGLTGSAVAQTVGPSNSFSVSVYATDSRYNWTSQVTNSFQLTSNDPNAGNPFDPGLNSFTLSNGSAVLSGVTLYTASTWTLTATNQDSLTLADGVSGNLVLNLSSPHNLRVLLPLCPTNAEGLATSCPPGTQPETRLPGEHAGLRGRVAAPLIVPAGMSVPVIVDITDAYWNLTPGASQEIRLTVPGDPYAVVVPAVQQVTTSGTFTVTFYRAGPQTIHVDSVGNSSLYPVSEDSDDSTLVTVAPGNALKLLTVVAPEAFDPGSASTGKIGQPAVQTAGQPFQVMVGIVDQFFNLVPGVAADLQVLIPTDPSAPMITVPIQADSGQTLPFTVTLQHAATGHFLHVIDYTDPAALRDDVSSTFTVLSGPPAGLAFVTPPRRLIAGTTIQFYRSDQPDQTGAYQVGAPTASWIAAALVDQCGNITTSTSTYTIQFQANDLSAWGAPMTMNEVIIATQPLPPWSFIGGASVFSVDVSPGYNPAPFYLFDTTAGTVTITAQAAINGTPVSGSQDQSITPGAAAYLSIHHPYSQQNPLPVGRTRTLHLQVGPDVVGITARDLFGNIARGDPINGNYYNGTVDIGTSGSSATVSMGDLTTGATYHTFTGSPICAAPPCDYGSYTNLGLSDVIQEVLDVQATDHYNPKIWGATDDRFYRTDLFTKNLNDLSTGPVYLAGVVVTPADLAPESPIPPAKLALGVSKSVLYEGDGSTLDSPAPIPMLRLAVSVTPAATPPLTASLKSLRVNGRPENTLANARVAELALYADANGNAKFDPAVDTLVATGTFDGIGAWSFGSSATPLSVLDSTDCANLSSTPRFFFLTVRLSSNNYNLNELPASFGLSIPNPTYITLTDDSQAGVAQNHFAIMTATSDVERQWATIRVNTDSNVYDINAWWQPLGAQLSSYSYVTQGQVNVGVFQLNLWTDALSAVLNSVRITHAGGTGPASDITKVRLFLDAQGCNPPTPPGDGIFKQYQDCVLGEAAFPSGQNRATLYVSTPYANGLITGTTRTYFIAVDYSPAAQAGQTHGFVITANDIIPLNGDQPQISSLIAAPITIQATSDVVLITTVNKQGYAATAPVPTRITQNDADDPVMQLSLQVPQGSAEWRGLKLDRWMASTWNSGTGQYNPLYVLNNKASDVDDIRVWVDANGDGLFEVASDTKVSQPGVTHNFPTTKLAVALSASVSTTNPSFPVTVTDIKSMFPADDPWQNWQTDSTVDPEGELVNRLVLGDDQTDETKKEIVVCTGVDKPNNRFTGCARGQEGTAPLSFATGTVLSGPARIRIRNVSGSSGQALGSTAQDYFITYQIDPLATVSPSANLGVIIGARQVWDGNGGSVIQPNTAYFLITSPKQMGTPMVGVPVIVPGGKTVSLVPEVDHVVDRMLIVSTDAVDGLLGPFAQQGSTRAVANFTVQTGISDAQWRWLLVFATGSATANGSISGDVDQVSLWSDANGDAILEPTNPDGSCSFASGCDVLVGTGTFGNWGGNALAAQVQLNPYIDVVTPALAPQPQRYFVAYHVTPTALPVDALGQPRTVGAQLLPSSSGLGSLPSGYAPDSVSLNAVAYPNVYDPSSNLPFTSKLRPIVAAPEQVFVKATPYFSNSSGTFPSPVFGGIFNPNPGVLPDCWLVTSTSGLSAPQPGTTGYFMIDGEIMSYSSLCSTNVYGAATLGLVGIQRGLLGTVSAAHIAGTPLGTQMQQGANNLALMKLEVWSSAFQVEWSGLQLSRLLPAGLNGADTDISQVRIYKSVTADGLFHRDPATGVDAGDPQMGSASIGQSPDTTGIVTVPVSDPGISSPGYALITPTTAVFYVAVDVSPTAKFSNAQLIPPNEVFGAAVTVPARFQFIPANGGNQAVFVTPTVASPVCPLVPTINPVNVVMAQISAASAYQNDKNVPMLRLQLYTTQNSAILQSLRLDRVGASGALDSDITLVKVWSDPDNSGLLSSTVTAEVGGSYPNMLSYGNETFSSGTATIILRTPVVVTTTPAYLFVTYDLSPFAAAGSQEGVSIGGSSYLSVQAPNTVVLSSPSFVSNPYVTIQKVTAHLTLGVDDLAQNLSGVRQAQQNVAMLRFNLATDISLAPVRSLRLERTGAASLDPTHPLGRNTDVKFVRVYRDINQNDALDGADVNLSEVLTSLVGSVANDGTGFSSAPAISSTTGFSGAPSSFNGFNMVVVSTAGFPVDNAGTSIGGQVFVNGAELMTFSSAPGCQFQPGPGQGSTPPGSYLYQGVTYPCLTIISRGNTLGQGPTPLLTVPNGASVKKVDVFDQDNDSDVQTVVTFSNDQFISPTAGTFFVAYDVGDAAVANDLIGLAVRAPTWIGTPRGDVVQPQIRVGETRAQPLGAFTTGYPFVGMNVTVSPITLSVYGLTIAPSGAGLGMQNVALMQLQLNTNTDFTNIAQLRLTQTGTDSRGTDVSASTTSYLDFSRASVWLDNGSGIFNPTVETRLGSAPMPTAAPAGGAPNTVTISLSNNGVPYLHVTTATAVLYIAADLGASTSTLGDRSGLKLNSFTDILAPNGAAVTAAADSVRQPPFQSNMVTIQSVSVPAVALSSSGIPIIVTRAQAGVPGAAVGFPAYAEVDAANCNNGRDVLNLRNDICHDGNGNPIPDQRRWICSDGAPGAAATPWCAAQQIGGHWRCVTFNCPNDSPLLDVNGDGIADNFIVGQSSRPMFVSLTGDGLPARDLTGTGILDMDLNQDGIVDMVFQNSYGGIQIMLGDDATDQGNAAKATPVPDQGFVPSAWSGQSGTLNAMLPMISATGYYQIAVGAYYDDPTTYTGSWVSVSSGAAAASRGLSARRITAQMLRTQSAPATTVQVGDLPIPVAGLTRLTQTLATDATTFSVANAGALNLPGIIYVGSEIMRAAMVDNTTLRVVALAQDPPPGNGRGLHGSAPIAHLPNEPVSDGAAVVFARYVSIVGSSTTVSAARPMLVYRSDSLAPSAPGAVQPLAQGKTSYALRWNPASQGSSGVTAYELQERGGDPKDLAATVLWRSINLINSKVPAYTVGDSKFPGEAPRSTGDYYSYRVRAMSGAGVWSPWSPLGLNVNTGLVAGIITGVSNYPNPFDTRKGGSAGQTTITYTLNADADVTITIYDLLGYVVKTMNYPAGTTGGQAGPNFVPWDGRNGNGTLVSKGGYIARIKVKSTSGSSEVLRKIGVIH